MKQLNKRLRVSCIIILATLTVALVSCGKDNTGTSAPDVTPKTPPAVPVITADFTPARTFMAGKLVCNAATSSGKLTYNGAAVTGPITFNNVTTAQSFTLNATVTDNVTGLSASKELNVVSQPPYAQDTTYRCANSTLDGYAVWTNTSTLQSTNGGVTWTPGPIDPSQWIYYPNGDRESATGGKSAYQISFVGGNTYINLGRTTSPPNLYKQESLTSSTMILSKTDQSGTMFKITYTK